MPITKWSNLFALESCDSNFYYTVSIKSFKKAYENKQLKNQSHWKIWSYSEQSEWIVIFFMHLSNTFNTSDHTLFGTKLSAYGF